MKLAIFAAVAAVFSVPLVKADDSKPVNARLMEYVNCDALNGESKICVFNQTSHAIVKIECVGLFTSNLTIPRGRIPAGKMSIINFDSGRCKKTIRITTAEGQQHTITGQDISAATVLPIESDSNW